MGLGSPFKSKVKSYCPEFQTRPKLFLTLDGVGKEKLGADSEEEEAKEEKPLLYMFDLQCLVLYTMLGIRTSFRPQ